MLSITTIGLVAANIALLFVLLGAPLGVRTLRLRTMIAASPERLWSALHPLGDEAGWSGEILSAVAEAGSPTRVRQTLSWEGRDGKPIERIVAVDVREPGKSFESKVVEDTALDRAFWASYRERVTVEPKVSGCAVTLERTDRYRGAAFLVFRYFAMRREMNKLKAWAETGRFRKGGVFEHPATQVAVAVLSAFLLWPLFGLNLGGLAVAGVLTAVVALHELGHMAAFRLMGHRRVRMIFIPLLGGIAIGGRPYDSRFEVAFVALMGAGFSAFLVPIAIAASAVALEGGHYALGALLGTLAGIMALFNLANLFPIWKFDGGQVLRQICTGTLSLAMASFAMASAFLALGYRGGMPFEMLVFSAAVFILISLATAGTGVKPRHDLKPMTSGQRAAIAAALIAVFAIHAHGVLWAAGQFATWRARQAAVEAAQSPAAAPSRRGSTPAAMPDPVHAMAWSPELSSLAATSKPSAFRSSAIASAAVPASSS